MGKSVRTMTLVVPGLLGPLPGMDAPAFPRPHAPAAERLLARGRRAGAGAEGYEAVLCGLFGLDDPVASLPLAALTRLADTGQRDAGWWLRADPVHLRADQSRLILFDDQVLHIQPDECSALLARLESLYGNDEDWHLEAPVPSRWYLRSEQAAGLETTPLPRVIGAHVDPHLPRGPDAARWHRLLNEVQMLFHQASVNAVREADGRPTINSVWFWGGGRLPQVPAAGWRRVWSDDPLAMGLASLAGVERSDVPATARDWLADAGSGTHLVVLDGLTAAVSYGDVEAWVQGVEAIEQAWLAPLADGLAHGGLRELDIQPCNGYRYRVGPGSAWRLWRRPRPLAVSG
jgi:hypothetical protein